MKMLATWIAVAGLSGLLGVTSASAQSEPPLSITYSPSPPNAYQPFNVVIGTTVCDVITAIPPMAVARQGNTLVVTMTGLVSFGEFCVSTPQTLILPAPALAPGNYIVEVRYQHPFGGPPPFIVRGTAGLVVSGEATQSVPAGATWAIGLLILGISGIALWRLQRS